MRPRLLAPLVLLLLALPACQFAKVGGRCNANQGAARTSTHVLFCVKDRWRPTVTIGQAAGIIVSGWPGAAVSSIGNELSATTSVPLPEFDLTVTTRSGRPAANAELTLGLSGPVPETRLTPRYRTDANGVVHVGVPTPLRTGFARNGIYTLKWYGPHPDPILTQTLRVSSKPVSITVVGGTGQTVTAGQALAPVVFEVRDVLGLRARGATLRLDAAEYLGGPTVTDVDGLVTVQSGIVQHAGQRSFNLNLIEPGPMGTTISHGYINVPYTVNAGPLDDAVVSGDDQAVPINTAFVELSVRPVDAYGNFVPGVGVTFTAIPGPEGASGTVTPTGSLNLAAAVVANGTAGEWTVRAEMPGLGFFDYAMENLPA